jgi:NitT/TauT family transport system ATP-binding protein
MLFMDEPFSQVDALTAESLRAEVLDVWATEGRNPSSIVMVSHDIKEVAFMADRIVVLDANPGRVRTVVENGLPRPRDYRSPELLQLVDKLHDIITGMEMPDAPVTQVTAPVPAFEPLPAVLPSEVMGLLEYLDARGGQEEVFRIASDTDREFGTLIGVVNAAELLDLVDTPRRMVVISPDGAKMIRAEPTARPALWREHLLRLRLFQVVRDALERSEKHRVERDFVLEVIAVNMPSEDYERMFQAFVNWARFGDLFAYDEEHEEITLP